MTSSSISVAIIGAGFAGIGAAIRLKAEGVEDFVIFERDSRVGGTWRDNTYPGAACDIPSRLYSYSFAANPDWSHTYSGSAEILEYIDGMVESSGIGPTIRFGHTVLGISYDAEAGEWTVDLEGREPVQARSVIVAAGPLANASFPNIPGIDTYEGHKIHSARWDHDYDFADKRVAVVGTGASGVQIVPELVKTAKSVKVFQRTPGWVLPRINTPTSGWLKRLYRNLPVTQSLMRSAWYWGHESVALGVVWDTPFTRLVEAVSSANLRLQVKDPWLRRQLTPDFSAGCKRLLMTSEYYPALQADNCKLVTWPIARLSPTGFAPSRASSTNSTASCSPPGSMSVRPAPRSRSPASKAVNWPPNGVAVPTRTAASRYRVTRTCTSPSARTPVPDTVRHWCTWRLRSITSSRRSRRSCGTTGSLWTSARRPRTGTTRTSNGAWSPPHGTPVARAGI